MFKLPQLQPHLTGSSSAAGDASRGNGALSQYSPFFSTTRNLRDLDAPFPVEDWPGLGGVATKSWEAQARDITQDIVPADKFKSLALHAEVKLSEALDRCSRLCPTTYTAAGDLRPGKLRTAVCMQLLGEFADLCGPFSGVLRCIRDELVRAVYSSDYSSELGNLTFDQLPWFVMAERLEGDKALMMEERQKFTEMLKSQQALIAKIESQLATYQEAMQGSLLEAATLRARLDGVNAIEESARAEARTGREELKRLRKEWLKLKDEMDQERSDHKSFRERTDKETLDLHAQLEQQSSQLASWQRRAEEAERLAATRLPPESVAQMQEKISELEARDKQQQRQLEELRALAQDAQARMGCMTPRPTWRPLAKFGVMPGHGVSTQDLVNAVAVKLETLSAAATEAATAAAELELVLADEPAPAPVTLTIATDASAYFITEDAAQASSVFAAESLGMGPRVPRCLRRPAGTMVESLRQLNLADTEAAVCSIIRAKQVQEATAPAQSMPAFLYSYLGDQVSAGSSSGATGRSNSIQRRASTPVHDLPAISSVASVGSGDTSNAPAAVGARFPPLARHYSITQKAYALYHSLATHAHRSPMVYLFLQVLSGQLSEQALSQSQLMFSSLIAVARQAVGRSTTTPEPGTARGGEASGAATAEAPRVPTAVMHAALQRMCSGLPSYKVARLLETYSTAVHPDSVELPQLERLLTPLASKCDATAQARRVRHWLQRASDVEKQEELRTQQNVQGEANAKGGVPGLLAIPEPTAAAAAPAAVSASPKKAQAPAISIPSPHPAGVLAGRTSPSPPPLRPQMSVAAPDDDGSTTAASLSNPFVAALLNLFVEHHDAAIANLEAQLATFVPPPTPAGGDAAAAAASTVLGTRTTAAALIAALVSAGAPEGTATDLVASVVFGGAVTNMRADSGVTCTAVTRLPKQAVWSGLATAKLLQQHLLGTLLGGPDVFPNIRTVLAA